MKIMSNTGYKSNFISCIKVKGIHLVPPVITESRRLELQRDKKQAIKLEKRLQNCKALKRNLEELLTINTLAGSPHFVGNSHIEELGITSATISIEQKTKPNLTRDILDITEYSNDGIRFINKDMVLDSKQGQFEFRQGQQLSTNSCSSDAYDTDSSLNKSSEIGVSSIQSSTRDHSSQYASAKLTSKGGMEVVSPVKSLLSSKSRQEIKSPKIKKTPTRTIKSPMQTSKSPTSPRKRLIRSNSYTLEAPSPILLAHLEKCNKMNSPNNQQSPNLSRTWTSLENNFTSLEDSELSSLNTVYNLNPTGKEQTDEIHLHVLHNEEAQIQKESPSIEVVQTDISVQQITVNANSGDLEPIKTTFNLSDPSSQLMEVLKKIPENYSKQIIEIIEKQRAEHNAKVEDFGKQFSNSTPQKDRIVNDDECNISELSNSSSYIVPDSSAKIEIPKVTETENDVTTERKVQSENLLTNKSVTVHDDTFLSNVNNRNLLETDDTLQITPEKQISCFQHVSYMNIENLVKDIDKPNDVILNTDQKRAVSSRKLIFNKYSNVRDIRTEWAANLICAHVKGYLTRRLLRTAKVQTLIETIRDALLCALQLHEIENIDEADIELHRRLINQVSAACYAFHDIFFSLSASEKMGLISADRQRLTEKSLRPSSAPDYRRSISSSSRSSTKSLRSQSLMKI